MKNLLMLFLTLVCCTSCGITGVRSAIDSEAETKNSEYWSRFYVKCGDSYYGQTNMFVWSRLKSLTFVVSPESLTNLDRENGYEWKGAGIIRYDRQRDRLFGVWGDWRSGGTQEVHMTKQRGKWWSAQRFCCQPPSCEEIAQAEK